MELDAIAEQLLDQCARAIVERDRADNIDLSALAVLYCKDMDGVVEVLTQRVEALSDRRFTVRWADPELFPQISGVGLSAYLVACPFDTSQGVVTRLGLGMVLVEFGPYSDGLVVGGRTA